MVPPSRSPLRVPLVALPAALPFLLALLAPTARAAPLPQGDPPRIVAWNDLGMHCIDPDFSVFAILPPFNDINAQLVIGGRLQTQGASFEVTYEGVDDPSGSRNTTSIGKTEFWDYEDDLFGVQLPLDVGLTGNAMPGLANVPQPMELDPAWSWFQGDGIPITPIDDTGIKNPYPLMRIVARDLAGSELASTVTVVPNSQELTCSACHASGRNPFARPSAGWVYSPEPERDDRFNILRLHDEKNAPNPIYAGALATAGYDPAGLFATATGGTAVLCARCHGSNALPGTGQPGIPPLTEAIHSRHANVRTETNRTLTEIGDRTACYYCHPGRDTQCLRGAMGKAIGSDGRFSMHCQSCHGQLADVGQTGRIGWLDQPSCQNCHSGDAQRNSGQIRFTSVFDASGNRRVPASQRFATTPDVPAAGFDLYRFSDGHGGLQCSACHGPPHAIVPTAFANDDEQNRRLQGHAGTLTDCTVCHASLEDDQIAGPHGMHPVTQAWAAGKHSDAAEQDPASCRACHGLDSRGTELSLAQGPRTFATPFGTKTFFEGAQVGCYHCHDGPNDENPIQNAAPVVPSLARSTPNDLPLAIGLAGSDADGDPLTFRVIAQPEHGTVGLVGATATYYPEPGYLGTATFTYAAHDTKTNSNLASVTVTSGPPDCPGTIQALGFGWPGTGGELPTLSATGCPTPGENLVVRLADALGGAQAYVFIAGTPTVGEVLPGIVLQLVPEDIAGPFALDGSGAGNGGIDLPLSLPPGLGALSIWFQGVIVDPGATFGVAGTNGLRLDIR